MICIYIYIWYIYIHTYFYLFELVNIRRTNTCWLMPIWCVDQFWSLWQGPHGEGVRAVFDLRFRREPRGPSSHGWTKQTKEPNSNTDVTSIGLHILYCGVLESRKYTTIESVQLHVLTRLLSIVVLVALKRRLRPQVLALGNFNGFYHSMWLPNVYQLEGKDVGQNKDSNDFCLQSHPASSRTLGKPWMKTVVVNSQKKSSMRWKQESLRQDATRA